jgi:hypothetical protein
MSAIFAALLEIGHIHTKLDTQLQTGLLTHFLDKLLHEQLILLDRLASILVVNGFDREV